MLPTPFLRSLLIPESAALATAPTTASKNATAAIAADVNAVGANIAAASASIAAASAADDA